MNYIDGILIFIIALCSISGYKTGLFKMFGFLVKWFTSLMGAIFLFEIVKQNLNTYFLIKDDLQNLLSFILSFIFLFIIITCVVNLLYLLSKKVKLNPVVNKISGAVIGSFIGLLVSFLVFTIISLSLWKEGVYNTQTSISSNLFKPIIASTSPYFSNIFFFENEKQRFAGVTESTTELNYSEEFKSNHFNEKIEFEKKLFELVNTERKVRKIKTLQYDSTLHYAANLHCVDLFNRGYFSHTNPEGLSPFNRLEQLNIKYSTAGENLAFSTSTLSAHNGLMNSPGHRANILNPKFGRIGICILQNKEGQLMVVQEFRN